MRSGRLPPGAVLPGEAELGERYGVSRVTVRKALNRLKDDGILDSRQGFGWFVEGPSTSRTLEALMSVDDQIDRRLLSFGVGPPPDRVVDALGGCTEVLEIRRCSLAGDRTVGRNTTWAVYSVTEAITVQLAASFPLHRLLLVPVGGTRQTVTAEAASAEDAELLDVPPGSALLRFDRTTYDVTGRPVLYTESVYDPRHAELTLRLPVASAGDSWLTLRPVEVPGPAL